MNSTKKFDFDDINQYNKITINLDKEIYLKIDKTIHLLNKKYEKELISLYLLEKNNMKKFDFKNQIKFINMHQKLVANIIEDTIDLYKKELINLEVLFLSGSFARGTNKMSSDIDLHFFYNSNEYNYIYEEIVCYIISRVLKKSRDCVDPTFVFNIQNNNKKVITKKMTSGKLVINLKSKIGNIKYSYKEGKKRRFYLQYINNREISSLFSYLGKEMKKEDTEWIHCFKIIVGKENFCNYYDELYLTELNMVSKEFISNKINKLILNLKMLKLDNSVCTISNIKKNYQSIAFKNIYEYVLIIRLILINRSHEVKYFNLLDIYDIIKEDSFFDKNILIEIYKYIWEVEKLSVFCYSKSINYGLHNNSFIEYPTYKLEMSFERLKILIIKDLERLVNNL